MSALPDHKSVKVPPKTATVLRPSASVLLISPINHVLLLHRVKKASSFASAHVFPGGALSSIQDGSIPPPTSPAHHQDSPAYRLAAIRETFEECGILLATSQKTGQLFTEISDAERDRGRRAVHAGQIRFRDLLEQWGAVPDVQGLLPFTRWITPPSMPKRFSTQMYLYFLPLCSSFSSALPGCPGADADGAVLPTPTHDGGIEHTAARFLAPAAWLRLASNNEVLLFPPQFFLLYLLSLYLGTPTNDNNNNNTTTTTTTTTLQRSALLSFLHAQRSYSGTPEPAWADACISPIALRKSAYGRAGRDGGSGSGGGGGSGSSGSGSGRGIDRNTTVLDLSSAGLEIEALGAGRKGVRDWLLTAKFGSEGPREMAVWKRDHVLLLLRGEEKVRGAL